MFIIGVSCYGNEFKEAQSRITYRIRA